MQKNDQTGLFKKLFGSSKKENCCGFEVEEIPVSKRDTEEKNQEKQLDDKHQKSNGCGCCCG